MGHQNLDLKQIDCCVFLHQKMGLFRINKELQFGVSNYGDPYVSPHKQEEENSLKQGRRWGSKLGIQRVHWRS